MPERLGTLGPWPTVEGADDRSGVRVLAILEAEPTRPDLPAAPAWEDLLRAVPVEWAVRVAALRWPQVRRRLEFLDTLLAAPNRRLADLMLEFWARQGPPLEDLVFVEVCGRREQMLERLEMLRAVAENHRLRLRPAEPEEVARWLEAALNPHRMGGMEGLPAGGELRSRAAPERLDFFADGWEFPDGVVGLPLTLREEAVPGDPLRPLRRLAGDLLGPGPGFWTASVRRMPAGTVAGQYRTERTAFGAVLEVLAEKLGRTPSYADAHRQEALNRAESALALGEAVFELEVVWAFYGEWVEAADRRAAAAGRLDTAGIRPQRFYHLPERALRFIQPGGPVGTGVAPIRAFAGEFAGLLPRPGRSRRLPAEPMLLGTSFLDGDDVYFSFRDGFDPDQPRSSQGLVLVLGEMGSGKTTLLLNILLQRLARGRAILSVDPEGELNGLCAALGGRAVPAGPPPDRDVCLLHPLRAGTAEELMLAARFLCGAVGGEGLLGPGPTAALAGAVKVMFSRRGPGVYTVTELAETLKAGGGTEGRVLAAAISPYCRGEVMDWLFDRPRALIEPDGAGLEGWVNVDLSGLREENRALIYAALSWLTYHAVTLRSGGLDAFIDEAWRLLRPGPFADLVDELSRRVRKRGMGLVLATHRAADIYRGGLCALYGYAFVGRLPRTEAQTFLEESGFPADAAAHWAEVIAALPRRRFVAVGPAGTPPVGLEVAVPEGWLRLIRETSRFKEGF